MIPLVPRTVDRDLLLPERGDGMSPYGEAVAVPEVPVHEYSKALTREDNIGSARESWNVLPESVPTTVQRRSHGLFESGIAIANVRHASAALLRAQVVGTHPTRGIC
jgi:hypothetical protein